MSGARRRFRFIKEIAEGGFGKVYLAEQLSVDGFSRIVAIKLLHAKWSSHDEIVMRTRDEARLLGLIRHQHIVKVEDLTSIDGKCAIVMEYLEGVDLKNMMTYLKDRGEIFPRAALFEIILASVSALDAAYNGTPLQGGEPLRVIHRDIKPSNIFITVPGAVKVLDFGTARANFAEREAKTQALAFGSQGYMAPERMLGEEDTPAGDVFSLGVSLYELLSFESFGRIPPRPQKFLAKVQERVASVPLHGDPEWQEQVRDILRRMLAYDSTERPTAAELMDQFEVLAQNARDTGLRKFCRTVVADAKAAEPEVQSGDPLTGSLVEEDLSSTFGLSSSGASDVMGDLTTSRSTSRPQNLPVAPPAQSLFRSSGEVTMEEPVKKPGIGKWIAIGVVVLVLIGLGVVGIAAVGGIAWFSTGGPPKVDPPPLKPPDPPPPSTVSEVFQNDPPAGKPTSLTVLKAVPGAMMVKISGVGFRAEWNGKADFDLGQLAEGNYRANIEIGGNTERTTFKVEGNKACEFTFEAGKKELVGGCK